MTSILKIVAIRQADTIHGLEQSAELGDETGQPICGTGPSTGRIPALCRRWRQCSALSPITVFPATYGICSTGGRLKRA